MLWITLLALAGAYSDSGLTVKATMVAFLALFCCTTELVVSVLFFFNVLTMHLKMKPKGNY